MTEHPVVGWARTELAEGQGAGFPYGQALLEQYDAARARADHLHALLGNCSAALRIALDEAGDPVRVAAARRLLRQSEAALHAAPQDGLDPAGAHEAARTVHDHEPYIRAVATALEASLNVQQVGPWTRRPRRAAIWLMAADDWDDYRHDHALLQWHETAGWTLRWGGLTQELPVPVLAAPHSVASCTSTALGPTWRGRIGDMADLNTCTAEALARYTAAPA